MKFGLKVFSKCKNNGELSLFSISTILKRIFLLEIDPDAEMQHINLKLLNLAAKEHIWVQRSPLIFKNYLFSNQDKALRTWETCNNYSVIHCYKVYVAFWVY